MYTNISSMFILLASKFCHNDSQSEDFAGFNATLAYNTLGEAMWPRIANLPFEYFWFKALNIVAACFTGQ